MTEASKHGRPNLRGAFVAFAVFLFAFYWLVVASYPSFFIFNPFDDSWGLRQGALVLSLLGWVIISTAPALILISYAAGTNRFIGWLPVTALLWPTSVLINQCLLYIRDGQWYFDYLLNHPIFVASDVLLPTLLMFLWWDLRTIHGRHEG